MLSAAPTGARLSAGLSGEWLARSWIDLIESHQWWRELRGGVPMATVMDRQICPRRGRRLTLPQVARIAGVDRSTVWRWVDAGLLRVELIGSFYAVEAADVEALLAERRRCRKHN